VTVALALFLMVKNGRVPRAVLEYSTYVMLYALFLVHQRTDNGRAGESVS
jgi:hypothetical protein